MVRIDAGPIAAKMVDLHALGDRSVDAFVVDPMRRYNTPIAHADGPVPIGIDGSLPDPTSTFILDVLSGRFAPVMVVNEANWLSLDPATFR